MNIVYLSYRSMLSRRLSSLLSWLLLSFGVMIVVLILLISDQLKKEIGKNAQGIDLVVGAKGSPLQLILSCIFHVDFPTGNISLKQANTLSKNRYVEAAIPLSLGDSYGGARIVGTTQGYGELYDAKVKDGRWFEGEMQAVIGAGVAQKLGLSIGDHFESQHGLDAEGEKHEGVHGFEVVGLLQPSGTVLDQLILVDIASIWEVHGHEDAHEHHDEAVIHLDKLGLDVTDEQLEEKEITAMLIKYRSPMAAVMLPRIVNDIDNFQAASPAYETARLFNILGMAIDLLTILGILIIIISAVSVFIALLNSLKDRKYDIAIMRSMGATKMQIFVHILAEGIIITFIGSISGLLFAHAAIGILGTFIEGLQLQWSHVVEDEFWVVVGSLCIGIGSAIIPAILAYKTDISKTLSKG
jgi:putative ABC transport system permease protein